MVAASAFDTGGNGETYDVPLRRSCAFVMKANSAALTPNEVETRWIARLRIFRLILNRGIFFPILRIKGAITRDFRGDAPRTQKPMPRESLTPGAS